MLRTPSIPFIPLIPLIPLIPFIPLIPLIPLRSRGSLVDHRERQNILTPAGGNPDRILLAAGVSALDIGPISVPEMHGAP